MKKEVKDTIISQLGEQIKAYPHFYIVDVTGLNAQQTSDFRREAFNQKIKTVVVKNKLLIKAFDAAETDFSELYPTLKGNTALMFCETANVPAKLLKEYKDEEVYCIGGESVYRQLLDRCDEAFVTMIDFAYEADAYFPDLTKEGWEMVGESEEQTYFDLCYTFTTWKKK